MQDYQNTPEYMRDFLVGSAERDGFTDGSLGYVNKYPRAISAVGTFYRVGFRKGQTANRQYHRGKLNFSVLSLTFWKNLLR